MPDGHFAAITRIAILDPAAGISGDMLLVLGVLMLTGQFTLLTAQLARWTPEWLSTRL